MMNAIDWEKSIRAKTHNNLASIFGNTHVVTENIQTENNPQTKKSSRDRTWSDFDLKPYGCKLVFKEYRSLDGIFQLCHNNYERSYAWVHKGMYRDLYIAFCVDKTGIGSVYSIAIYSGGTNPNVRLAHKVINLPDKFTKDDITKCLLDSEEWLADNIKNI